MFSFLKKNKAFSGYTLKVYLGLTGSGKTLSAIENEVVPALKSGRKVYSNMWLNYTGSNLVYFTDWSELRGVKNSLIFVDEVGYVLDPYKYLDYEDADKDIIRFHRKRFNDIIFTSQDISQVAKTIRVNIHLWVLCQSVKSFFLSIIYNLFYKSSVIQVRTLELTFRDLGILAQGLGSFDLNSKVERIEELEDNFSESFADSESVSSKPDLPKPKTFNFKSSDLIHEELQATFKHRFGVFCSECNDFIKLVPLDLLEPEKEPYKCLSHKDSILKILPVPFYLTNQEIERKSSDYIIKKFVKKNKEILVPYTGS